MAPPAVDPCSMYLICSFYLLQAINSPDACKKRLVKYVIPVVLISILINVPKFLESQVKVDDEGK